MYSFKKNSKKCQNGRYPKLEIPREKGHLYLAFFSSGSEVYAANANVDNRQKDINKNKNDRLCPDLSIQDIKCNISQNFNFGYGCRVTIGG